MNHLVILGAGTAGTMTANKLRKRLPTADWTISVVDSKNEHHYQPGYLFIPFGTYERDDIVKPTAPLLHDGIDFVFGDIDRVDTANNTVVLADGSTLEYDQLVIATGNAPAPRPDRGPRQRRVRLDRARLLHAGRSNGARRATRRLARGTPRHEHRRDADQVPGCADGVHVLLADAFFTEKGIRDKVELVYVTPLDGAFTKPVAAESPRHDARTARHRRGDRLHDHGGRHRTQHPGELRRS